ncbi:MAG: hypothetical protein ISQ19_04470 [PS1 clade bacterium]|uniref:Uncharacterized protein n=1 Tax=PS1 clade bacterium TaxID=2175152 RepID=A0A937HKL8_9PROT|nr:hypothetical protein [PS1 clade bacterium]
MSLSDDFLRLAEQLVRSNSSSKSPPQIDLRRAVSSAYYAVFHEFCLLFAEQFVCDGKKLTRAWLQTYRSLEHQQLKKRLLEIRQFSKLKDKQKKQRESKNADLNFPPALADLADIFAKLQDSRHEADYNPQSKFDRKETILSIESARGCIEKIRHLCGDGKSALAVFIGIKKR